MVAIKRKFVNIWVTDADVDPSSLATSDAIVGEISNYSLTGGQDDVESQPVFGGYVDKEKPRDQFEVAFEIIPKIDSNADRWDSFIYGEDGSNTGVYTSASSAGNKAIFIQANDSATSTYKSYGFNNCNAVNLDFDHAADDNRTASMTFKFSPSTSAGVPNFMTSDIAITSLPDWDALDAE